MKRGREWPIYNKVIVAGNVAAKIVPGQSRFSCFVGAMKPASNNFPSFLFFGTLGLKD